MAEKKMMSQLGKEAAIKHQPSTVRESAIKPTKLNNYRFPQDEAEKQSKDFKK